MITRRGSAKWEGGLKDGKGSVSTQSGVLSDQRYGFATRFEDGPGTNPEELVGAAHAACFSMQLSALLENAGITGVSIETTSAISMDREGDGFSVKKAHLTSHVRAEGDKDKIEELARQAEKICPISKLLKAEITLDLTVN